MSCLAHVFEDDAALDKLEAFASLNGPAWYGLSPNDDTITLEKHESPVSFPSKRDTAAGPITVFDPGFPLLWNVAG
jgi:dihydroorotase